MMKLSILAIAALVAATGAVAAEPSEADAAEEKKICKTEKITGSLTRVRRTCMTKAQWDRVSAEGQKATDEFVRRSQNNQSPGRGSTLAQDP